MLRRRDFLGSLVALSAATCGLAACSSPAPATAPTQPPAAPSSAAAPTGSPPPLSPAAASPALSPLPSPSPSASASPVGSPVAQAAPAQGAGGPVQIGFVSPTPINAASYSAMEGGYFQKYGLNVNLQLIATSPQAIATIISGEIPINTGIAGTQIVAANLQGADTLLLASVVNTFPFSMMVDPSITTADDLRGKKIGVTQFGSATDTAARVYLGSVGLDASNDLTLLQTGGPPQTIAALEARNIDGCILGPPDNKEAADLGFATLADLGRMGLQYCTSGIGTTRSYYAANQELLTNLARAMVEGIHRFKNDEAFGKAVIQHLMNESDPDVLEASWGPFAAYYQDHLYVTDGAVQTVLNQIAATDASAQSASPTRFYDNTILNGLESSGFFASVGVPPGTS